MLRSLTLALATLAAPALADPFTIFIYETPAEIALRADTGPEGQAYWGAFAAYGMDLGAAITGGAPLVVTPDMTGADGLILSGFFHVEAASLAEAQDMAARAPSQTRGGTAIAIAQMDTASMMQN